MKTEISHFEGIRVVEEGREGSTVFIRPVDPKEIDTGEKVEYDPEQEQLILTTPHYFASLNKTPGIPHIKDILTYVRVVPDGRDGSKVYCRLLLPNELDTGLAVQFRPGDTGAFREGNQSFSVDIVDKNVAIKFEDGYAYITNTVWTWLYIYPTLSNQILAEDIFPFLLSTARRLDASYKTFSLVQSKLKEWETIEYDIEKRNLGFEIIGLVEIAIIAMNRTLQMAWQLHERYSVSVHFPDSVKNKLPALQAMRNAYEHIEDRALGFVNGRPNADALSIFNFERLFNEGIATYGSYELNIYHETIQLLVETRKYLKETTSELARI